MEVAEETAAHRQSTQATIPLLSVEQKNGAADRGNYSAFRSTQVALNLE